MKITLQDVLLVIDVQIDFCPGGALAVSDGDGVIGSIQSVQEKFDHIVLTQDWHPVGHVSFASAHEGRKPFDVISLGGGEQVLWPDHCVQGSRGAEIHPALGLDRAGLVLRKGFRREMDSYSAFFENDHSTPTGLGGYLRERGLRRVFLCGLAYDFCVGFSAIDARRVGFEAIVLKDACRAIDTNHSILSIEKAFDDHGVGTIQTREIFDRNG